MGDTVASRSMRMLDDLKTKDEAAFNQFQDGVKKLVSALEKFERSLNRGFNSSKDVVRVQTIRSRAYTVEDILETWVLMMETADMDSKIEKKRSITRLVKWCMGGHDDDMAMKMEMFAAEVMSSEVEVVNTWIQDTFPEADEIESSVVRERGMANHRSFRWPRQMYAHPMDEHFIWREYDFELISRLTDQEKEHRVVSICGFKGLGKTTLARALYFQPQVRSHFKAFAWVDLSRQDYQIGSLAQDILNQLTAGAVQMSVAEEQKKGSEEKKKGAESLMKLGAATQKESAPEKSEGAENGKLLHSLKKLGAAVLKRSGKLFYTQNSAQPSTSGLEGKKEGEEEEPQPKSREQSMMDTLKGILRQKRCLLVIDGISKPSQWSKIRSEFLMEDTDTKILLTTDDETTARSIEGYHHLLMLLSEEESWQLLQKYVGQVQDFGVVPKLGLRMLMECRGIPSKISKLGRILSKMDFSEWHKVYDDVMNGCLEREDDQIQPTATISNDLSVPSYDDQSYCLKQFFLYLAIFKGDEGVDQEDLSFLWMAEGIVTPQEHQGAIMDTANYYLQVLNSSGMLQEQVDKLSVKKGCKRIFLSDDARKSSLSKGKEEGFRLKVVDFSDEKQRGFDSLSLDYETRRLVIHFNEHSSKWKYDVRNLTSSLRSLLFINSSQKYVDLPVPDFGKYKFEEYSLLRVVHFVRCKFEDRKLPEGIAELSNLRYLGVLYCDLDRLPTSISNLRNLQVLNVRAYDDARITIPDVIISKLVGLKHLRLPKNLDHDREQSLPPLKLDGLKDLETLIGFNADIHDINSLSQLQNLRHLEIHASSNDSLKSIIKFVESHGDRVRTSLLLWYKCDFTSREKCALLEEVLMCPHLVELTISMVPIHKFPNCGTLASKDITQIKLIGCKLREDPMEALGKFPKLQKLCLGYGAFVGRKMSVSDKGFPELEYLEFCCLPNLEELSVGKGVKEKLSASLTFSHSQCPKFTGITEESAVDSSLNNSVMEPAPPSAIAGDCEMDVHTSSAGIIS